MTEEMSIYDRWDQFMRLLSAQPRRQIISSLMNAPEQDAQPLPDAAMTPELSIEPERFQIKLRQIHLPLLADADYVLWTKDPFQVRRGPRFEEPASVMDVLLSADDRLSPALVSGCVEDPP